MGRVIEEESWEWWWWKEEVTAELSVGKGGYPLNHYTHSTVYILSISRRRDNNNLINNFPPFFQTAHNTIANQNGTTQSPDGLAEWLTQLSFSLSLSRRVHTSINSRSSCRESSPTLYERPQINPAQAYTNDLYRDRKNSTSPSWSWTRAFRYASIILYCILLV